MSDAKVWLNALLDQMVDMQGSDLHLTSGVEPYMRLNNDIVMLDEKIIPPENVDEMVRSLLTTYQIETFERQQSVDMAFFSDRDDRFRANVFRQRGTSAAVIRHLQGGSQTMNELMLPPQLHELSEYHHGLVLVTGATGSGKSTTLSTILNRINETRASHILTIEDPIEFIHQNKKSLIRQRELHSDVPCFGDALRAALREDPDVILVGEMRDLDTIRAAITAAETGHLVFSTLHTGSASAAISRVISQFPAAEQSTVRMQLATCLKAVVSQRLVHRSDNTGRVPIIELMIVNSAIANLIRTGDTAQIHSVMQTGLKDGMIIVEHSLACLVVHGILDLQDAERLASDPNILHSRIEMIREPMSV
ncbi:MAG: twitching motility protein PilT [Pirellulaceae bacterium]|jgi:twitching motility protein PilT